VLVNVSARELRDPGFVETIEGLRDEHRLSPKWLKLEITEAVVVDDPERVIATLKRLRELGILIALDDFGTGFSSLSYLARLPVDAIKIDRSFILAMRDDARVRSIVRATIELAHSLGFGVVAEGVENATTLGILTGMSCDMAQGFHIARPMPADTFDAWLPGAAWKPRPVPAPDAIAATATSKAPSAALPQAFIAAK
jgi:EAL domain-containing protein (putative c-di-GMP-specific phosphodiesterase class I)